MVKFLSKIADKQCKKMKIYGLIGFAVTFSKATLFIERFGTRLEHNPCFFMD